MATDSVLRIVVRAVNEATAEMARITKDVQKFSKTVEGAGKKLSTSLTLPIVAMGAASVKAFADFEKGMANVSTLIDTNVESLADMSKATLAISRRVPVEMGQLTEALYDVRSAGVSAADQFAVLEGSARLGVAGLGTTKEATDLVTSSLNAFQLQGEEADRVYDTIFKTVKSGKTNIAQLAQGFGAVAGTVADSGTKLDEYLASVAALTTTGLPASQAHSQLRAVLSGLTGDSAKLRKVFRGLGAKDLKDLIEKSGGLVPALERVSKKLNGNTGEMKELFGSVEALNAVIGLTGAQNAAYVATLEDMRNGANAVDTAFQKQNKTMQAQAIRTKNALTSAGVAIGAVLAPALEKFAAVVQRAADWVNGLDDETRDWVVGIGLAVAAIGPALIVIGKMAAGISALKAGLTVIQPLMTGMVTKLYAISAAGTAAGASTSAMAAGMAAKVGLVGMSLAAGYAIGKLADQVFDLSGKLSNLALDLLGPLGAGEAAKNAAAATKRLSSMSDEEVRAQTLSADRKLARQAQQEINSRAVERGVARSTIGSSAVAARPNLGAATVASGAPAQARVTVDFANAPRGMRAQTEPGGKAEVDLSVGYQMVMP